MQAFENSQPVPVCRLVALKTKFGLSGRSASVLPRVKFRYFSWLFRRKLFLVSSLPSDEGASRLVDANSRTGLTICSWKLAAQSCWKSSRSQLAASAAATIEPPDTVEISQILLSWRASFSRQRTPRWNRLARYPPPHNLKTICGERSSSATCIQPPSNAP